MAVSLRGYHLRTVRHFETYRVDGREIGIRKEHGTRRILHIQFRVAAVPVRHEHRLDASYLLDHHVVQEDGVPVHVAIRLLSLVDQACLGDELRPARIGDVEDVDVCGFLVIHENRVCLGTVLPGERGVNLVRVSLAFPLHREITETLDELLWLKRIRHVDEGDAPHSDLRAGADLVLIDQQVARERWCIQGDDLRSFAAECSNVAGDLRDFLRRCRIGDVHDVDAAAIALRFVKSGEVGVIALGRHIRDSTRFLRACEQVDVADLRDVVVRRWKVALADAVLRVVMRVCLLAGVDGPVVVEA